MKLACRLLFFTLAFFTVASCRLSANFHEIDPGKMYRSAQLTGEEFQQAIETFGIRTIINLRGENPDTDWFQQESEVAQRNNVLLINIPMSAKHLPHRKNLLALLEAFASAPRPLLIHCKAGADRTGEASALYQMLYMGKTKEEALKMLTPKYLHMPLFMPAKRYFIKEVWQGFEWALAEYEPCQSSYKYYDVNNEYCHTGRNVIGEDDDT